MMVKHSFIIACLFLWLPICAGHLGYKTTSVGRFDKKVSLYSGSANLGFLYYKKIWTVAVLYNLYIYPNHRDRGFAQTLLNHVSHELKTQGVKKIFIQPGPFELSEKKIDAMTHQEKIDALVRLYTRTGFLPAPSYLKRLASLCYYLVGLPENSDFLMNS